MQTMGATLLHIESHYNSLTKTEQKAAKYILEHAQEVIYYSVTELAEKADIGETTVLRLCRKLKYKGFQDFKLSLAQDLVRTSDQPQDDPTMQDNPNMLKHSLITAHVQALEQTRELLDTSQIESAVELILTADSLHFFGVGSSGLTAAQAAHSFARIGKHSYSKQDAHFQAVQAALMNERSVAIGISISGSTKDTIENLQIAKQTGARIIAVTSNARSPITKLADYSLLMVAKESPLQGSSMTAKIAQLAVLDILAAAVAMQMKEKAQQYRERTAKAISDKML